MNAPKSGLFACLLFISFIIHACLFMLATTHYLDKIRTQQGRLILNHLSEDSVRDLANTNPVSLALLANRYAYLPNVAALRIFDHNNQTLVVTGSHKTHSSEILTQDVRLNDKIIGRIELSLLQTSHSEVLSHIWWAIFFAFLVHLVLWGLYILVLRPYPVAIQEKVTSTEALEENPEIQHLKQTLQEKERFLTEALQEYEQEHLAEPEDRLHLALSIKFFDPKELLRNVSPTLSEHYFNTCQVLLDRSIELCCEHFNMNDELFVIEQAFNEHGAKVLITEEHSSALDCLLLISSVSSLLFETLYKTYRQHKRFALPTCSAISSQIQSLEFDAITASERLLGHAQAQQTLIHLETDLLRQVTKHYQLMALANPHNLLMRQSFIITGMDAETATIATEFRSEILQYRA